MWVKDGKMFAAVPAVVIMGRRIFNPSRDEILAAGYQEIELPAPDPGEWVNISDFVGALYELVPAETVAGVLQNPTSLKPAIAGMALLSSDAAPDGRINLADERVAEWLPLVGVTLEQVREVLATNAGAEADAVAEVEAGTETGAE